MRIPGVGKGEERHMGEYVDTRVAADEFGISASTLNKLRLTGGGPTYIKVGRRVIYKRSEIVRWLDHRVAVSTSDYR